jgi:hypothetical protein
MLGGSHSPLSTCDPLTPQSARPPHKPLGPEQEQGLGMKRQGKEQSEESLRGIQIPTLPRGWGMYNMNSSKRNRSCRRLGVSCAGLISSSGELGSEYPLDSPRSAPCLASSSLDLA